MKRRTLVVVVVAAVIVSSVTTWIAKEWIRSPAEIAARTAPPAAAPILVPVVEQVLATKVVTRGTGRYGSPREVSVTPSALKTGPGVITRLPRVGSQIGEGDVLLTISGRPAFVLEGTQPSYRDLGPGMSGGDVEQLEEALVRIGLDPGQVDTYYDAQTEAAVEELYRRHGFDPVVATDAQLAAARTLEAGLVDGSSPSSGLQLPADEVIFVPTTPLRVSALPAAVGESPSGPLVTVTSSDVVIDGFVPVEQVGLIKKGAEVVIDEPALGISTSGRVSLVAERPGTHGADGLHVYFRVAVEGDAPAGVIGSSLRLTIPVSRPGRRSSRSSERRLARAGRRSRVQRSSGDAFELVAVRTGLSADGYVTVTPSRGARRRRPRRGRLRRRWSERWLT
jgi:peptidoglycan hydrolase-like protein with peptidoglycan-binding domain